MIVRILLLVAVSVLVCYYFLSNQVPMPLPFNADWQGSKLASAFAGQMAWLFAVALFIERAVEVVVMAFRDQGADLLDEAETRATGLYDNETKAAATLTGSNTASQADKDTAIKAAEAAQRTLAATREQKVIYRAETKEIALSVGFVLGILVSLAGVRALRGLLADNANPTQLFSVVDIVVTGAMLAGGSEGVHRIANVFTSTMDNLSARQDQSQKNLKNP